MLAIIVKASDWKWYEFKELKTIEDILNIYPEVIISKNDYTLDIAEYWDGFKKEDESLLEQATIKVTIYDDYIE